ncbi:MAG: M28 family peptidase [Vicinamibacterales bacterium]|jgi:hypothetical protein|nr:hypothetical protein [Acidobacteriota bacterium]MDP7293801.1 M28 family peptidase [Vicinamibacterales bacterium]MDP7472369.1 M28 family peptidase [Vicinamibacterales bacterium]MDP7670734.1 M28 family peptidase [Vicinamibacterales bacterium]HJO38983.1 M28 family peptidase [Vicinamibacterales bacterium]
MKRTVLLLALLSTAALTAQERAPENDSIRQSDLRADLFFLASDTMQGRLPDTPENRLAAEFIKSRFERMGLTPAGRDGSYYHEYNLMTASLAEGNELLIASGTGESQRSLRLRQDYYPLNFSASGRAQGDVVFAGFGIVSADRGHDDYSGGSVEGKIVVVLNHEPGERDPESVFDGLVTSEASRAVRKAVYAQERGAAGLLIVTDAHNHPSPANFQAQARGTWPAEPRRVPRYTLSAWMEQVRIPVAQVSPAVAEALVGGSGYTLDGLGTMAEVDGGVAPIPLVGPRIELGAAVDRRVVPDRNVVGMIEGSDPELADEVIIICAHYDHDGADGVRVFAGADDDGSGTVALLEIAEAYARAAANGQRPRRSVLFAAWNSEERGLLGAWAYTEDPIVPLDRTVAVLNMDMVGRNEEVPVGGGRRFRGLEIQTAESNNNSINIMGYSYSPDLRNEVEEANEPYGLRLKMDYDNNLSNLLRRSDQWPFLQNRVPALFFHTGLHPDYHTTYDRPEKINYPKLETIARLVHQVSWNLAESSVRPRYAPVSR